MRNTAENLEAEFMPMVKVINDFKEAVAKVVQKLMKQNDCRAAAIYETMGVYFGYIIAYYSIFYDIKHVLIMGRVTSGNCGAIILEKANEVLKTKFPELFKEIQLHIPR